MGFDSSAGWRQGLRAAAARDDLAACNEATAAYGLSLTEEQVVRLAERRCEALKATGRVEFGREALRDIDKWQNSGRPGISTEAAVSAPG